MSDVTQNQPEAGRPKSRLSMRLRRAVRHILKRGSNEHRLRRAKRLFSRIQESLNGTIKNALELEAAFASIVEEKLWSARFNSFVDFAFAPDGLNATTPERFAVLRALLIKGKYYDHLTQLLRFARRLNGRPRKTLARGESFVPFWGVSRAEHGLDHRLLKLWNMHRDLYRRVCSHELSVDEACLQAGIGTRGDTRLAVAKILRWLPKLTHRAYGQFLCEAFSLAPLDAQCALFSCQIEPKLGLQLAETWRAGAVNREPSGA